MLRGAGYGFAASARWTTVFRFAAGPYGIQRSMTMSPIQIENDRFRHECNSIDQKILDLRGRGGAAGIRSIITERGGTGSTGSFRTTV